MQSSGQWRLTGKYTRSSKLNAEGAHSPQLAALRLTILGRGRLAPTLFIEGGVGPYAAGQAGGRTHAKFLFLFCVLSFFIFFYLALNYQYPTPLH
jgi:hypothetical protein